MRVGMLLEGGGMRGMYTAGVLDSFLDNEIKIDCIVGVSAGALFGVNYASKQRGRAIRYNTKYVKHPMYMSMKSLIQTGNIVNKEFAYYILPQRLDIFDQEQFGNSNIDYYATVTNVESGEAEYLKVTDAFKQMEILRASSALPFVSQIVEVDGNKYLDGGIADSIPIDKIRQLDVDKVIVVLTRPLNYRKNEKTNRLVYNFTEKKYGKNLADTLEQRNKRYNESVEKIIDLESKKEIFVIRPTKTIKVKRLEKDVEKITEIYNLGLEDANNIMESLKNYLNASNN